MRPYAYPHFDLDVMKGDYGFQPGSPGPNDVLPAFTLMTTEGDWVRNEDFAGRKWLLTVGSIT